MPQGTHEKRTRFYETIFGYEFQVQYCNFEFQVQYCIKMNPKMGGSGVENCNLRRQISLNV